MGIGWNALLYNKNKENNKLNLGKSIRGGKKKDVNVNLMKRLALLSLGSINYK